MNNGITDRSRSMRVAIYARVSSEQQAQEQTIASQVAALHERVAADGSSLDDELRFIDDGISGTTLQRPALERLRDQAYAGGFQKLYVHSPDRLARRYAYQVLLVEELRRYGVEIVFLNRAWACRPRKICSCRCKVCLPNTNARRFWSAAAAASGTPHSAAW